VTAVPVHVLHPDLELGLDWLGRPLGCTQCPLPPRHPVHEVPDRPDGDVSDRIVGERED